MKNIRNLSVLVAIAMMLAVSMIGFGGSSGGRVQAQTLYVPISQKPDTRAANELTAINNQQSAEGIEVYRAERDHPTASPTPPPQADQDAELRRACAEAVDELRAGRKLLEKQDVEIRLQGEMLALEREISAGLKNLRNLDAGEKQALRQAIDAKDRQIASTEAALVIAKKNQWTIWKATKAAAYGAAAGILIATILRR